MKTALLLAVVLGLALAVSSAVASDKDVNITHDLTQVSVVHEGKALHIERVQDTDNRINPLFTYTSRKCPPFCIQPMQVADGVETIDELQMLDYLKRRSEGDDSVLIVDSRGPGWVSKGTIPGSVNIRYKRLSLDTAEEEGVAEIFEDTFGVERTAEFWNFRNAKTLVLFCNGLWCGQSPTNIRSLLRLGYPASKLKYFRGGMQSWETLGLTTVVPVNRKNGSENSIDE